MERDLHALLDIVECCRMIADWMAGVSREDFERNAILQRAILYEITIIGEATTRVSDSFKDANRQIEWRQMKSMRNLLVHKYDEVNVERVWEVVQTKVPDLLRILGPMIPPP